MRHPDRIVRRAKETIRGEKHETNQKSRRQDAQRRSSSQSNDGGSINSSSERKLLFVWQARSQIKGLSEQGGQPEEVLSMPRDRTYSKRLSSSSPGTSHDALSHPVGRREAWPSRRSIKQQFTYESWTRARNRRATRSASKNCQDSSQTNSAAQALIYKVKL